MLKAMSGLFVAEGDWVVVEGGWVLRLRVGF